MIFKIIAVALIITHITACFRDHNVNSQVYSQQNRKFQSNDHKPVPLRIFCELTDNGTYEVHLDLNRKGLSQVIHAIYNDGYIGEITHSAMHFIENPIERIAARTNEIHQINNCLGASKPESHMVFNELGSVSALRNFQANGDDFFSSSPSILERNLEENMRLLSKEIESGSWHLIYKRLGTIQSNLYLLTTSRTLAIKNLDNIKNRWDRIKESVAVSGVMKCPNQWIDPKIVNLGSPVQVRLQKHLLNRSCFPNLSEETKLFLRSYVLITQIFPDDLVPDQLMRISSYTQIDFEQEWTQLRDILFKNENFKAVSAKLKTSPLDETKVYEGFYLEFIKLQGIDLEIPSSGLTIINQASKKLAQWSLELTL